MVSLVQVDAKEETLNVAFLSVFTHAYIGV